MLDIVKIVLSGYDYEVKDLDTLYLIRLTTIDRFAAEGFAQLYNGELTDDGENCTLRFLIGK